MLLESISQQFLAGVYCDHAHPVLRLEGRRLRYLSLLWLHMLRVWRSPHHGLRSGRGSPHCCCKRRKRIGYATWGSDILFPYRTPSPRPHPDPTQRQKPPETDRNRLKWIKFRERGNHALVIVLSSRRFLRPPNALKNRAFEASNWSRLKPYY